MTDIDFEEWRLALKEAVPRGNWPKDPEYFWKLIREDFDRYKVSRELAFAAIPEYARSPGYLSAFHGVFTDALKVARHKSVKEHQATFAGSREEAAAESAECPECSGCGMTARRMRLKGIAPVGKDVRSVTWFCLCPMGQYLAADQASRQGFQGKKAEVKIPNLAKCNPLRPIGVDWEKWAKPFRDADGRLFDSYPTRVWYGSKSYECEIVPDDLPDVPPGLSAANVARYLIGTLPNVPQATPQYPGPAAWDRDRGAEPDPIPF